MEGNPESMGRQEAEHTEGQAPAGGVSRRRVLIAGAMLAPVFMTLRVPTASAGGGDWHNDKDKKDKKDKKYRPGSSQETSDTASCTASECPGGPQGGNKKGGQTWWGKDSGNHKFVDEWGPIYGK